MVRIERETLGADDRFAWKPEIEVENGTVAAQMLREGGATRQPNGTWTDRRWNVFRVSKCA